MKIKWDTLRLTSSHFCYLFFLFALMVYMIYMIGSKTTILSFESSFAEVENDDMEIHLVSPLSFVLFHDGECEVSQQIEYHLSNLAQTESLHADYIKINGVLNEEASMRYKISGFPSILILKNGVEVERILGASSYNTMKHICNLLTQ